MSRALKIYVFCSLALAVAVPSYVFAILSDFSVTDSWDFCEYRPDNSGEIDFLEGDSCAIEWGKVILAFLALFAFVGVPLLLPVAVPFGLRWVARRVSRRAPS